MFPQLDLVTCPDVPLRDKVTYFASVNLFHGANIDEKQIKVVKAKIHELLISPLSRCDGLLLFEAVLQQHTPFYVENWPRIVIANLQASNNICQEVTYRILKLILRPSNCPNYRYNVGCHLDDIIEQLITSDNSNSLAAVECLSLCTRLYPANAANKLRVMESFVIKQMDTNSTQICEAAAECIIAFPHCSVVAGSSKNAFSKRFASTFRKVLYTLQEVLNLINNDDDNVHYIDGEDSFEKPEIYVLPDMPDTEFSEIMMLARIFSSLSVCAAKFLCRENAVFEVPLLWILNLIHRVFNLSESAKMCESIQRREFIILLYPVVQKGAFTILESLVQNFGLVQQTGNIISILKNAIKASYIATFTGGTNCQMRIITWRILNIWLKKNGTQISIEAGNNKDLLRELFMDIIPENIDEIPSTTVKRQHQVPSKKKNQPATFPLPLETGNFKKNKIATCSEALKVLYEFVNSASPFLEEKFKEDIANQVFAVCHKIQKSVQPQRKYIFPYVNDKCRKNLFKIVVALGTSSDFNIKVLQQAFAILRIAEKDKSCKINLLCRRANSIARHMLHPKKKFPEAVTNKKAAFESPIEEDICSGWENAAVWNVNHSNQENHVADPQIDITENNASLSPEAHNSIEENEIRNKFVSDREYSSTSKFDTSLNSSRSESENESIMEQTVDDENNQESNGTRYANTIHTNDIVKNESPTEIDVSSEDDNSSVGEEELEDTRVEEEEVEEEEEDEELNLSKVVDHTDQNGLASTSEDEENATVAFTKSENGEYSTEGSCGEEETSKEVRNDFKHEIETLDEDERPTKKQRLNEDPPETLEDDERLVKKLRINDESIETLEEDSKLTKRHQLIEDSVEVTESENLDEATKIDDTNTVDEEIIQNSSHQAEESRTNTPTFDEMCADLVLSESSQLADS